MSKTKTYARTAFRTSALQPDLQAYDLRRMIELEFISLMERDYGVTGLAVIEGSEDTGYTLTLRGADPLEREEQIGLLDIDQSLIDGVRALVAGNYPIEFDLVDRVITTPALEVLVGLLGNLPNYADEDPAFTPEELINACSAPSSGPALRLH